MLTPSTPPQRGEPDCPTPANPTAASLQAPAAGQGEGTSADYAQLLERIAVLAHSGLCTYHFEVARDRLKEIRELCEPWDLLKHPERLA